MMKCRECASDRVTYCDLATLREWAVKVGHPASMLAGIPPELAGLKWWRCAECLALGTSFVDSAAA